MITITETPQKVTVSGHAGYAERGKDIVCEAVTSQVQTLVSSICQLCGEHPKMELHPGFFSIEKTGLSEKSNFLVSAFMVGMDLLQSGYSEHVRVLNEETESSF